MALTADSTFVDGFPADPGQPDYGVQAITDGELRNCQALEGTRGRPPWDLAVECTADTIVERACKVLGGKSFRINVE
jgi:hypothetical protein